MGNLNEIFGSVVSGPYFVAGRPEKELESPSGMAPRLNEDAKYLMSLIGKRVSPVRGAYRYRDVGGLIHANAEMMMCIVIFDDNESHTYNYREIMEVI